MINTKKSVLLLLSQGLQPFLPTKFLKNKRLVGSWSVKLLRTPLYLPVQKKRNVDLTTFLLTYRHSPLLEKCHFYRWSGRTDTLSLELDFESSASAYSATPA